MTTQPQDQTQSQDQTVNTCETEEQQPTVGVFGGDINLDLGDAVSPTVATGDTDAGLFDTLSVLPDAADLADVGGVANNLALRDTLTDLNVSDVLNDAANLDTGNIADGLDLLDVLADADVSNVVGNVASADNGGSLLGNVIGDVASTSNGSSLVGDVADADLHGLSANVSDVSEHLNLVQGLSVADDADALGSALNGESVGSIADLDGNSIVDDVVDTCVDATGAADLSSFLSALNDVNATDLTGEIANGNLTDADVGGALTHLTGPIGSCDGIGTTLDLADVGAILTSDLATHVPVDSVLDGLMGQVNLHDIADVGGMADHC